MSQTVRCILVANNTYHELEHLGERSGGRSWKVIDDNPYVEVAGKGPRGDTWAIFCRTFGA